VACSVVGNNMEALLEDSQAVAPET
jgi:hypothetical protein